MLLLSMALAAELTIRELGSGRRLDAGVVLADGTIIAAPDGWVDLTVADGTVVTVIALGCVPVTLTVSGPDPVKVWLKPGASEGEIVVEARRDDTSVVAQHLDRERVNQTPGTYGDAVRLVQSLPGVTQTPEYSPRSGDIAVRGAFPGDNHYYLDGVELPYLFHYNNYASVLPTRLVESLTLYPSTFSSAYGDATGAIIATESVRDVPDRVRASANLSLVMAAGGVEARLPVEPDWVVRAYARRSYLDLLESSSQQYTSFPVFSDWFARVEHTRKGGARWAVMGMGAGDAYVRYAGEPTLLDPVEQSSNPEFDYDRQYQIVALQHQRITTAQTLSGSLSFTDYRVSGTLPDAQSFHGVRTLALREDWTFKLKERLWIAAGAELRGSQDRIRVSADRSWSEVARESELLARGVSTDEQLLRGRAAVYVEPRWELGTLRLQPGVRLAADSATGQVVVDPRMGLRWHPAGNTWLRAAAGIYSQAPTAVQLSPVLGDAAFKTSRSFQVAGGVEQAVAGRWEIALDGWAKRGEDAIINRVGEAPEGAHTTRAFGASLSTRYRLRDRFFAWASLDLMRSVVDQGDGWVLTDYDQPYAVNLVASWTFRPTWNVALRYRVGAGLPYSPITDGIYLAASDSYEPVFGEVNSARLPTYQKIDLHVEKSFYVRSLTLTPYLEAWYVPKPGNVMYLAWSYDYDQVEAVRGPGFIPLAGIRGEL